MKGLEVGYAQVQVVQDIKIVFQYLSLNNLVKRLLITFILMVQCKI